jgi:hypothetical protein
MGRAFGSLAAAALRAGASADSRISPDTKKFFCKSVFHAKATPLWDGTIFGQVFGRGGMTKFSKLKVPPTGGQAQQTVGELGTTRHCCAPRGLIARSFEMRCTVPVPMPSDLATYKIPIPSQAAFGLSAQSPRGVKLGRSTRSLGGRTGGMFAPQPPAAWSFGM